MIRNYSVPGAETFAHLELKRLALVWAQANGYPVAACEVVLPQLRLRLDVGAYRPATRRALLNGRTALQTVVGATAIFECKASRSDLIRDGRRVAELSERIKELTERRVRLERLLKIHYPSLRHGDALWPEYQNFSFDQIEHAAYRKVVKNLTTLSRQLHGQTKFESLMKWRAANLHYLVIEPGLVQTHEIPVGWGLLERNGQRLNLRRLPEWREVEESMRLAFLHRIAIAGTRLSNRAAGVDPALIERERRGLDPLGDREEESPKSCPAPDRPPTRNSSSSR